MTWYSICVNVHLSLFEIKLKGGWSKGNWRNKYPFLFCILKSRGKKIKTRYHKSFLVTVKPHTTYTTLKVTTFMHRQTERRLFQTSILSLNETSYHVLVRQKPCPLEGPTKFVIRHFSHVYSTSTHRTLKKQSNTAKHPTHIIVLSK